MQILSSKATRNWVSIEALRCTSKSAWRGAFAFFVYTTTERTLERGVQMLVTIDNWLQNRFQSFSDFSQVNFGKNCYWWACITVSLAGVFVLLAAYQELQKYLTAESGSSGVMSVLFIVVAVLFAVGKFLSLNELKQMAESDNPRKILMAPLGVSDFTFRMIELALSLPVFLFWDPVSFMFVFLNCSSYLIRCNPKPPTVVQGYVQSTL